MCMALKSGIQSVEYYEDLLDLVHYLVISDIDRGESVDSTDKTDQKLTAILVWPEISLKT